MVFFNMISSQNPFEAKYYKNVKKSIVIFCRMWYDKDSSAGVIL